MADKKVERSRRGQPFTPTDKLTASLSDQGLVDVADSRHDKGKAALVDKFRDRDERWRRDQAANVSGAPASEEAGENPEEVTSAAEPTAEDEGGAR